MGEQDFGLALFVYIRFDIYLFDMRKELNLEAIEKFRIRQKEYALKIKPSNDSLKYLDTILLALAINLGDYVTEDILEAQVNHPKNSRNNPKAVLRISTEYLKEKGLIYKLKTEKDAFSYLITFEGMVVFESGGLLKKTTSERRKERLQKAFWILAFFTFAVNTVFQVLEYFTPD